MTTTALERAAAEWAVWSTTARVAVVGGDAELAAAETAVRAVLAEMDLAASRFRDDSELVRLNAAGGAPVRVSPLLAETLDVALHAAARTRGAVDPTLGAQLQALGYVTDFSLAGTFRPSAVQPPAVAGRWRDVRLDVAARRVSLPLGVQLDLGALAKAHAADLAAARAADAAGVAVLVSLGGDVAVAGAADDGWVVRVAEAPGTPGPLVRIDAGGVATSTTTLRRWEHGGRTYHHLLDPATGDPVRGRWRTATVAAATCAEANTASTAALVLGEQAVDWLDGHDVAARLVGTDGQVALVGGWPPDGQVA